MWIALGPVIPCVQGRGTFQSYSEIVNKLIIKEMLVDVGGLEPPAPCLQSSERMSMLMARLALPCVLYHGFPWFSAANGPKLDPSFGVSPC